MTESIKQKETRKLVKTEDGKYLLTIINPETEYQLTQKFSAEKLKGIYNDDLKPQLTNLLQQLSQNRAMLKKMNVEDTEELRKLKENLEKLEKLKQKVQVEENIVALEKDVLRLTKETSEIEIAIPELKRNK